MPNQAPIAGAVANPRRTRWSTVQNAQAQGGSEHSDGGDADGSTGA